jgi:hypothetical protein
MGNITGDADGIQAPRGRRQERPSKTAQRASASRLKIARSAMQAASLDATEPVGPWAGMGSLTGLLILLTFSVTSPVKLASRRFRVHLGAVALNSSVLFKIGASR